ncbi:MAG: hypothetical protein D6812_08595 [Deltaproteobacteria bacterium]|nr:MAG: hypothetical protein D6812_08595 [Deltaproteobacteria bacterium]
MAISSSPLRSRSHLLSPRFPFQDRFSKEVLALVRLTQGNRIMGDRKPKQNHNTLTVVATERYSTLEVRESPARYVVARSVEEIVS